MPAYGEASSALHDSGVFADGSEFATVDYNKLKEELATLASRRASVDFDPTPFCARLEEELRKLHTNPNFMGQQETADTELDEEAQALLQPFIGPGQDHLRSRLAASKRNAWLYFNYEGFRKIIKKYNKYESVAANPEMQLRLNAIDLQFRLADTDKIIPDLHGRKAGSEMLRGPAPQNPLGLLGAAVEQKPEGWHWLLLMVRWRKQLHLPGD